MCENMTLATRLEKIEASGLIRLAQVDPEIEYIFRHALVQDATYESLLRADRRLLHQAVGRTLESLYANRLDDVAATLAFHFEKAEEPDKAVDYLIRAGEAASRIYAVNESIGLFGHALEILPPEFPHEKLTHLYSRYGRALELAGRFDAVIGVYEQMGAEGVRRNDPRMELDALLAQAILCSTPSPLHNFTNAVQLCERALPIARSLNNLAAQSHIYWCWMLAMMFEGRLKAAITYGEQSLELARQSGNRERLAFILNDIARCYASNGMIEKSFAANTEARAMWRELGNLPMLVDNLVTYAEYMFFGGEYKQGISVALEAYEKAKSIHNIWGQTFCLMILGFIYTETGEIDKAIETNQELISFDPRQTFAIAQISSRGHLAEIYANFGDLQTGYVYVTAAMEQAKALDPKTQTAILAGLARYELLQGNIAAVEEMFEKATTDYDPQNFTTFVPHYVERARYDILMYKGEYQAALEALDQILKILVRMQIGFCQPEFMFYKANALLALGRRNEALSVLEAAASVGERMGSRRLVWKIHALAADLHRESGHTSEADEAHRKAVECVRFILEHLPEDLRQSFLKLPEVGKLFKK